ncbi:hypothetical protein FRC10_010294 [Ceratobasidium sp. 414]|nr:hypothetical protein FRC10_010294 [Ceratobasidium sp. 414]
MADVQPRRARNIVVLCDGTGKNGQRDSVKGEPITNIWRLYEAIQRRRQEGDMVEYFPGVGAHNDKVTTMDLLAQMLGNTAVVTIRKIYMTIAENYREGDSISLFGYSRGAFIARKVASLIGALGLITDEVELNEYWKDLEHKLPGDRSSRRPPKRRVVPIRSVAASAFGTPSRATTGNSRDIEPPHPTRRRASPLPFSKFPHFDPDYSLPEIVRSALHVVAYHENRKLFDVVLFNGNNGNKQLCKQTLFPGAHSDVGGGAADPKHGRNILPDVTLDWMLRNIPETIQAALSGKLESEVPSWYPINSAYHDGPFWKRIPDTLRLREYLPTRYGLLRHRTLLGLPSPKSAHLLEHAWRHWEHFNSAEEEVANGPPPVKPSLIRRITDKAISSMTPTWDPVQPPVSKLPPQSTGGIESNEPQAPQRRPTLLTTRAPRPESGMTDHTDFTIDTPATVSTARTSLPSADTPTEFRAWPLTDAPDSPPSHSRRTSLLPIAERAHPVTEKVDPRAEGGLPTPPETPRRFGPIPGRPASTEPAGQARSTGQARPGVQVRPAPAQTGPAQVSHAPAHGGRPAPAPVPRPSPVQAGPTQIPRTPTQAPHAPPSVAQVGSAAPTRHTPARTSAAPSRPAAPQVYPPSPQGGVPTNRAPTQTGPAPAPAQASPGPARVRPDPVQVYPAAPAGPAVSVEPAPPARAGPGPARAGPAIPQVGSPVPASRASTQTGPARVDPGPIQVYPAPQVDPAVSAGPAPASARASPVPAPPQAGRASPQTHPSVARVGPAAPAGPAPALPGPLPAQASPAPSQRYSFSPQANPVIPASRAPRQASPDLAQTRPGLVQAHPAAPVGSAVPTGPGPVEAGSAPVEAGPGPVQVGPTVPATSAPAPASPAPARDRPAPAQAYPYVPQGDPVVPASRAPAQTGLAQVHPGPAQTYHVAQVNPLIPARPAPAFAQSGRASPQAYSSVTPAGSAGTAGRAPAPVDPVPVQVSPVQVPRTPAQAGPAPIRATPRPVDAYPPPAQAGPDVLTSWPRTQANRAPIQAPLSPAQVYPPLVQADPAVRTSPTGQFRPTTTQVYPTGSVGSGVRANYSPDIQARVAAQARAPVEAPAAQPHLTATQTHASAPTSRAFPAYPNRPRQKSVMQKIMTFFCCGSSDQMSG